MSHLPNHILERLEENKKTGRFIGDYVIRDLSGMVLGVRCMCCSTDVAGLQPLRDKAGELVMASGKDGIRYATSSVIRFYNWTQVALDIKDGNGEKSTANPIVCSDCRDEVVRTGKHEDAWACIMAAWEAEQIAARWPEGKSKAYFDYYGECKPMKIRKVGASNAG